MVYIGLHNIIIPFKDRDVDLTKNVEVYRCLNNDGCIYSVRQGGKVIGHTRQLTLKDAKFVIHKTSQERNKASKIRNIHAFVRGKINIIPQTNYKMLRRVTYDAYEDATFIYHTSSSFHELHNSETVLFTKKGIYSDILD